MVKAFSPVRSSLQLQNRVMPRLMQFVGSNPPGSKFYGGYTDSAAYSSHSWHFDSEAESPLRLARLLV